MGNSQSVIKDNRITQNNTISNRINSSLVHSLFTGAKSNIFQSQIGRNQISALWLESPSNHILKLQPYYKWPCLGVWAKTIKYTYLCAWFNYWSYKGSTFTRKSNPVIIIFTEYWSRLLLHNNRSAEIKKVIIGNSESGDLQLIRTNHVRRQID